MKDLKGPNAYLKNFPNGNPDIRPYTIENFFDSTLRISIPSFQRPYSWSEDEVFELLNDIKAAIPDKPWFIGVVYWNPVHFNSHRGNYVEWKNIIDGQQRLTTLFILFRELSLLPFWCGTEVLQDRINDLKEFKKLFGELPNQAAKEQFLNDCDGAIRSTDGKEIFNTLMTLEHFYRVPKAGVRKTDNKISLSDDLKGPFNEYMLREIQSTVEYLKLDLFASDSSHPSQKNLHNNREYIKEVLLDFILKEAFREKGDVKGRVETFIEDYIKSLTSNLWLISIPLSMSADIRIFEGINDRGQPLDFVSKFRFMTLTSKSGEVEIKNAWKKFYDDHGTTQTSVFNQSIRASDKKFTTSTYLSQFILSCGKDITEDALRLELLGNEITISGNVNHTLVVNLLEAIRMSVDFKSGLFEKTYSDSSISGLFEYNRYLNTYNDQTRIVQFYVNRFLHTSGSKLKEEQLKLLLWRLNNFIFAVNHILGLVPNKKRIVLIEWLNDLNSKKNIWDTVEDVNILSTALKTIKIDGNILDISEEIGNVSLLNLKYNSKVIRQYLYHLYHLSDLVFFAQKNIHKMRFEESTEHWLPQRPKTGPKHWESFLKLDINDLKNAIAQAVKSSNLSNKDAYLDKVKSLELKELRDAVVNTFGNLFNFNKKQNTGFGNLGHSVKKSKVKIDYFFNSQVNKSTSLMDLDFWTVDRIIERTDYLESIFRQIDDFEDQLV